MVPNTGKILPATAPINTPVAVGEKRDLAFERLGVTSSVRDGVESSSVGF